MKTTRIIAVAVLMVGGGLSLQIFVGDALKKSGADAVYYGTRMRGVSNSKAKRELNFRPRPLEWIVDNPVARAGRVAPDRWEPVGRQRERGAA